MEPSFEIQIYPSGGREYCKYWPVVYVLLDLPDVVLFTIVQDRQIKDGIGIEDIKGALTKVAISSPRFETERDAAMRSWEVYGYIPVMKQLS